LILSRASAVTCPGESQRLFDNPHAACGEIRSLTQDKATSIGALEAYDFRSLQSQRVMALLEMMRRAFDVDS